MDKNTVLDMLKNKSDFTSAVACATEDTRWIPILLQMIKMEKSAVKYPAEKVLRKVCKENPHLVYPYFMDIAQFLQHENHFIRLGAELSLIYLLKEDQEQHWLGMRETYLQFFVSKRIAEFGNAVTGVPVILKAYPEEEKEILPLLLNREKHVFMRKGEESFQCGNIAAGQVLDCFLQILECTQYQKEIFAFAQKYARYEKKQLRTKAVKILKWFENTESAEDQT